MTEFFAPAARGVQHSSLRAANRRAVLTTITFNPGISNAGVSRRTGLAPQTASAIVSELEADHLVSRGAVLRGRRGQPATPLYLNFDAACAIGCEISWRHLDIVLVDLGSREIARYRRDYAWPEPATVIAEAATAIADLLDGLDVRRRRRLAGIGLATPAGMDRAVSRLGAPDATAAAWRDTDLAAALKAATGIRTYFCDDGSAGTFAEQVTAPSPRLVNFAYLFVDAFISAGIVTPHNAWTGPTGNVAELGAMLVGVADGSQRPANERASLDALCHRLAAAGIDAPAGRPADWPWADWEPVLAPFIADAGHALAQVALNAAAVIGVEEVIIDGVLPPELVARLVAATSDAIAGFPATGRMPRVVAGRLGSRAIPLGAAQLPMFQKYFTADLSLAL